MIERKNDRAFIVRPFPLFILYKQKVISIAYELIEAELEFFCIAQIKYGFGNLKVVKVSAFWPRFLT